MIDRTPTSCIKAAQFTPRDFEKLCRLYSISKDLREKSLMILLVAGARAMDIMKLKIKDILVEERRFVLNKRERVVGKYHLPGAQRVLNEYLENALQQGSDDPERFAFPPRCTVNRPMTHSEFRVLFRSWLLAGSMDSALLPHALRVFSITNLGNRSILKDGADVE